MLQLALQQTGKSLLAVLELRYFEVAPAGCNDVLEVWKALKFPLIMPFSNKKLNKRVNFCSSKGGSNSQESNLMLSQEQFHAICQSIASTVGTGNNKKCKVESALDEEANYLMMLKQNNQSSNEEEDHFPAFSYAIGFQPHKKRKIWCWSTETVAKTEPVEINNKPL